MTTDNAEYQYDNLIFLMNIIFGPESSFAVHPIGSRGNPAPILHSIGFIETTLWLRLGVEIGFFEEGSVGEYLSSVENALSISWKVLRDERVLSSDTWCDFMSDEPKPMLMKDKFFGPRQLEKDTFSHLEDSENLEYLRQCFLGFLLLTSEVLFDETTMVFLESIGGDTDETWTSRVRGYSIPLGFGVWDMYVGFSNHFGYVEQLERYSQTIVNSDHHFISDVVILNRKVHQIVSQRLIFDRPHVRERCIRMVSEFVAMLNQPGPEWQEARRSIFLQVAQALKIDIEEIPRFWSGFLDNISKETDRAKRAGHLGSFEGSSFATE